MKVLISTVGIAVLTCSGLLADFSYQENTKITGGMAASMMKVAGAFSKQAREPIVMTVAVKGHRMAHLSNDRTTIMDVDKETITTVDFKHKTYSTMTFDQMKQQLQEAMARAEQEKKKNKDAENVQMNFKASVKNTGETKTIEGMQAKEVMLTLTMEGTDAKSGQSGAMEMVSDMWLAPVAGYEEVRNFYKLMAAKMGTIIGGAGFNPLMSQPELIKGMGDLYKEMAKLDGAPVQSIVGMGAPGAAEAALKNPDQAQPHGPSRGDVADAAAGSAAERALGRLGGIGGFGGFGHKKKKTEDTAEQQPQQQGDQNGQAAAGGLLVQMTMTSSNFSTAAVDESKFEVPAGFKQVEPKEERRR